MSRITNLGTRIELVSEDRFFRDISIGLHLQSDSEGSRYLVHTYSGYDGVQERIAFIVDSMSRYGGLLAEPESNVLRFPCGFDHRSAIRRLFVRVCRIKPEQSSVSYPLSVFDKKSASTMTANYQQEGCYQISSDASDADDPKVTRRIVGIRNGLVKLTHMAVTESVDDLATFACRQPHDALVGLLLTDALNVRAAVRDQEQARTDGVLTAPGQQER